MRLDVWRLARSFKRLVPEAKRIDQAMWLLLAAAPIVFLTTLPDQRSPAERFEYFDEVERYSCPGDFTWPDPQLPPGPTTSFGFDRTELDAWIDHVGDFTQLAHMEPVLTRSRPRAMGPDGRREIFLGTQDPGGQR